jgi:hypothetical protein
MSTTPTSLYLGKELIVSNSDVLFNNANVTVKAPISDLNAANKLYVDTADQVLDAKIVSEAATRLDEDKKLLSATSRSMIVPLTTSICGGQAQPAVMPSAILETGYDGWYYKKVSNDTIERKINWYLAPDVSMKVSDMHQLFFELNLLNVTSCPFITVYTKTDSVTPNAASWFKSSRTFEMLDKSGLVPGSYCCYMKFNAESPNPVSYAHKPRALTITDVVANMRGAFDSSEEILFFSIGTDSGTAIGNVEFICKTVCIQSAKGTQNFIFSNIHVESKAVATQLNNLYQYFLNQNRDGPVPSRA